METPGTSINDFMHGLDMEKMTSRAALIFLQFNTLLCQITSIEGTLSKLTKKLDEVLYRIQRLEKISAAV